ncbi:MAG: hypothetical protein LiPW41_505 [Parcubacteria group bacterium LiPW_41]|nr:MAG: hypothetical protein LiPW41_505 [Parcubacteria group bacterium LiPW_41]
MTKKFILLTILIVAIVLGVGFYMQYKEERRIMNIILNNPAECLKDEKCMERLKGDVEGFKKYQELNTK